VEGEGKGRRKEKGKRKEEKGKRKEEKGKREKRKKEKGKKRKGKWRKIGKRLEKFRKIAREIRGGFCGVFSNFPGVGGIFGPAVTARRTGWRDRGGRGIPGRWPTAALGRCAGA
jgi:hypothetical protein